MSENGRMPSRIAIATPGVHATAAGLAAIDAGGNAIDAAVSAIIAASATDPGMVTPFGGAYCAIWPAGGEPVVIDGNVEMPGRGAPPEAFGRGLTSIDTSYGGGLTTFVGPGSVATSGMFAALDLAHRRYGAAPWSRLFDETVAVLRSGYQVSETAASYLALVADTIFSWDPLTRALYLVDPPEDEIDPAARRPTARQAGDVVIDPTLADTLREIGDDGAQTLYTGRLARLIAADMSERGGLLTAADLAAYRAIARRPLRTTLGAWDVAANPPPSIGGVVLTAMLRLIARENATSDQAHIARIMIRMMQARAARLDEAADLEAAGRDLLEAIERSDVAGLSSSPDTVHVSVVDGDGNACAITASAGYGSGMNLAGTGLLGNNALGEPELNRRGLHALAPGTRLASNMAPTVARGRGGEILAIGSPGADRITSALSLTLARFCLGGESLAAAIDAPRLHARVQDGISEIEYEDDPTLAATLRAAPDLRVRAHPARSMYFGGVGAAVREQGGTVSADTDPRRISSAAVR